MTRRDRVIEVLLFVVDALVFAALARAVMGLACPPDEAPTSAATMETTSHEGNDR
jgi:hypothetical protein